MMKSYGLFGFLGFISLSLVCALPARAEDSPQVFISEINWAGSETSTADEWIELINLGSIPADLSNYVLTGTATSGGAIAIAQGTIIEPGATLIIANYALGDPKTSLLISPNLVTTAISLPNSALDILLTTPAGLVIDNYTDAGTPDFGLSNPATSIERDLTNMTWRSSTQSLNLSSISQFGTPGAVSLPATPEPTLVETAVIEPLIELPAPCTQVVLENELSGSPEPVSEFVLVTPEISPSLAEDYPSTPSTTLTPEPEAPGNAESNTLSVQKIEPGQIVINELVSDPTDGVEWVEILNTTSQAIDLTGSSLIDASANSTPLPEVVLAPGALIVIDNPNGNLNNAGDTITLLDSYGSLIDTLAYGTTELPAPSDGESAARNSDGMWFITTATRNTTNVSPVSVENIETYDPLSTNLYETLTNESDPTVLDPGTSAGPVETLNDPGSAGTEPLHRIVAIAKSVETSLRDVSTNQSSTQSVITGTVVALPDTFAKQIMYIDGHEIYFYAADWPELALGDIVQVTGTESISNGVPRIKISSAQAIVITGYNDLIPIPIDGNELASTPHGLLISIAGQITSKSGNELSIAAEDGTIVTALAVKKTGLSWSSMQSGSIIIIGIAKHTDEGVVIAPRSLNDIHFTPNTEPAQITSSKAKTNTTPIVGGGLLTGSVGALGTWYLRSRRLLPGLTV